MLQSLTIQNYALIRHTQVDFAPSFVAITGETGAGKSILLGALALLLGQRADLQQLHDPSQKCVVEATLQIAPLHLQSYFADNDLDYDDTLILRRELLPSGKTRAFVNDTPATLQQLKELGLRLVDIHSQHQTLRLSDPAYQASLLDALAQQPSVQSAYREAYQAYQQYKRELERLTALEQQNRRDLDYNQYLFDELQQARLNPDEQVQLEEESNLLAHAESIKAALTAALALCDGDDDSALSRLNAAKSQLAHSASCLPALELLHQRLDSSLIELRDILSELDALDQRIQYSPERQAQVDQRLDQLYSLQRKHNVDSVDQLIQLRDRLDQQLQSVSSLDQQIHAAMESVDRAYGQLQQCGEQLTALRQQSAQQLQQSVQPLLADLGMPEAQLLVTVTSTADYGPNGCDRVQILFNANRGGEMRELSKAASGGELSRLMLAVKAVVARASQLPTLFFDEIDTGISGDISMRVARILSEMGRTMQVVAITHLPQIASRAQQHLKVSKATEGDSTISRIRPLTPEERVDEIATMLSSNELTASARQTARELLNGATPIDTIL